MTKKIKKGCLFGSQKNLNYEKDFKNFNNVIPDKHFVFLFVLLTAFLLYYCVKRKKDT